MKVLVAGANGFIAGGIIEMLLAEGIEVIACARSQRNLSGTPGLLFRQIDMQQCTRPDDWRELLNDVDVVINCVGILRERRAGDFERIHVQAPQALAEACLAAGVHKFIQISALGSEADGPFITTKHRFDDWLLTSGLPATVIRPSVVVSLRGSYGGTSMLRALSALPWVVALPGQGGQQLQPVLLEDLVDLVRFCLPLEAASGEVLYAAGPEPVTLREYLLHTRAWLKLSKPKVVEVPQPLVHFAATIGEWIGRGPLGKTITGMLERGNIAPAGALEQVADKVGWRPRSVFETLDNASSFVQDRWHARLYLVAPLIMLALIVLWIGSGIAGLCADRAAWEAVLMPMGVPAAFQYPLVVSASVFDIALGVALLLQFKVRLVLWLMLIAVAVYTLVLGVLAPGLWLEPLGGLLKNIPILVLTIVALVLEDSR